MTASKILLFRLALPAICLATSATAQTLPEGPAGTVGPGGINSDGRGPWFVGASQAITHSSNVYRTPSGVSDVYSSTSLSGGLDQPLGRQRVYARGSLSLNRYRDESQLDNTSYSLNGGWSFDTVMNLSGGLDVGLDQQLAAPAASTAEVPEERRNLARTQRLDARLVWGGQSLISIEARGGYSRVDYADDAYVGSESSRVQAGVTGYYRPGSRLRVGLGVRADRTRQQLALQDPVTGATQSNEVDGRHIDLLADYSLTALTNVQGRVSYTRQSNSNPLLDGDDFSGLTGALTVAYRLTSKLGMDFVLSRDVGTAGYGRTLYAVSLPSTPAEPQTPTVTPTAIYFENNRVTTTAALGASYAATAKIGANARLSYQRGRVASTSTAQIADDVSDSTTSASLGVRYAVARLFSLGCDVSHERRKVTGGTEFSYSANSVSCNGAVRWP